MVIISNDNTNEMEEWSYRVVYFYFVPENHCRLSFLIIPFWLKWEPVFAMMACAASSLCTIFVMLKWLWVSVSWVLWRPAKRQLFLWCDYDRCPSWDDLPQPGRSSSGWNCSGWKGRAIPFPRRILHIHFNNESHAAVGFLLQRSKMTVKGHMK